jgi:hypothetical protein
VLAFGGGASAAGAISAFTKVTLPPGVVANDSFTMTSVIHMFDVELGYETTAWKYLALRFAIGGAFTVGSTTSIHPQVTWPPQQVLQPFVDRASSYVDHIYRAYFFTPVITLGAGYAFF